MMIDEIRAKIAVGEIKQAIKLLQENSHGHEDELAIHLMKLFLHEKNQRLGTIDFEMYQSHLAKVSVAILNLATIIEGEIIIENSHTSTPPPIYSTAQKNWAKFFTHAGWDFEIDFKKTPNWISDFIVKRKGGEALEFEAKSIHSISELKHKSRYIKPVIKETSLSNCIILRLKPALISLNSGLEVIQLGWIFNFDNSQWEEILLSENFNISNYGEPSYFLLKAEFSDYMKAGFFSELKRFWDQ